MTDLKIQRKLEDLRNKIEELKNITHDENDDIKKINIKDKITNLNKRKTFYLKQQIQKTETSVVTLFTLYYIILFILAIVFIYKKLYKSRNSIIIFIVLTILPIVVNRLVDYIIYLFKSLNTLNPVNNYTGLYNNEIIKYFNLTTFDLKDGE